jgi:hypothetical protein
MRAGLRRVTTDLARMRSVDAYVVSAIAVSFAVLSVVGDVVPDDLRWAVVLSGLGLLVYRAAAPRTGEAATGAPFGDRRDLDSLDVPDRLARARTLWLFAPSGVNFLSQERCDALREGILSRADGEVRVIVMDPGEDAALEVASRQVDDSVDFVVQRLRPSLTTAIERLTTMSGWAVRGTMSYRLLGHNPGLSIVIIDPHTRDGLVLLELHGCHGESTSSRMHLRLTPTVSPRWFAYWIDQYEHLWNGARPPGRGDS